MDYQVDIVLHQVALEGRQGQGAVTQCEDKGVIGVALPGLGHIGSAEDIVDKLVPAQ
jgi:hypothetical protein